MNAQSLKKWRAEVPKSVTDFRKLNKGWRRPDPAYGILAAAILWPVRDAAHRDNANRATLRRVCGAQTDVILEAMRNWPDDKLVAAHQLARQAKSDVNLKAALYNLLQCFEKTLKQVGLLRSVSGSAMARTGIRVLGSVIGANVVIGGEQSVFGDLRIAIFSSVRQVALVLFVFLAIITLVLISIYISRQPPLMTKSFNIAVAGFQLPDLPDAEQRKRAEQGAAVIRQNIYTLLAATYANSDIQVEQKNMGHVSGREGAQYLVEKTNADVVIWGSVEYVQGNYTFTPIFYVANRFSVDVSELSGENTWLPTTLTDEQLRDIILPTSDEHLRLQQKTDIMVEFTKALTYLATNRLQNAVYSIEKVRMEADHFTEAYSDPVGREVIYLFASTIYRVQSGLDQAQGNLDRAQNGLDQAREYADQTLALDEDRNYGRAYIALGNVHYDAGVRAYHNQDFRAAQNSFQTALNQYQYAADLPLQPPEALVREKAKLGIGNVYVLVYQMSAENQKPRLAQNALDAFEVVINSYNALAGSTSNLNLYLEPLAAQAAYFAGLVHEWEGSQDDAREFYEYVLTLTSVPDMKNTAQAELIALHTRAAVTQMPLATASP